VSTFEDGRIPEEFLPPVPGERFVGAVQTCYEGGSRPFFAETTAGIIAHSAMRASLFLISTGAAIVAERAAQLSEKTRSYIGVSRQSSMTNVESISEEPVAERTSFRGLALIGKLGAEVCSAVGGEIHVTDKPIGPRRHQPTEEYVL
jgi:hypothetical protein